MKAGKKINRREFIGTAAATSLAFTIVPRHVLGGPGMVAPSDKLVLAYIGCGTQGMREMTDLIAHPKIQIVAVCDPNKKSTDYIDWSANGIRDGIRKALGNPGWGEEHKGIPGGRDIGHSAAVGGRMPPVDRQGHGSHWNSSRGPVRRMTEPGAAPSFDWF